jgi:hypothetical protein
VSLIDAVNANARVVDGRGDRRAGPADARGATLTLAMRRYANAPTAAFPWDR